MTSRSALAEPSVVPRWIVPCLVLIALACALPFVGATLTLDIVRDLVASAGIVRGDALPLRGPVFNAMFHLGPVWYYILAVPIALTQSLGVTLLFVGVLSALKIPLAYACGRHLLGWRFGVAWAALLALPGWNIGSAVIVTHTAIVESAVLLVALFAIRLGKLAHPKWWLACGLACGLAVHAHPSVVVLAPMLLVPIWHRRQRLRTDAAWIVGGVGVAGAFLLPAFVAEARDGWPALDLLQSYARSRLDAETQSAWPFLRGVLIDGPMLFSQSLRDPLHAAIARVLIAAIAGIALAGLFRALQRRELRTSASIGLAGLAIALLGLFLLRPTTPFYMALALTPLIAGTLAIGVIAWQSMWTMRATVSLATTLSIGACLWLLHASGNGLVDLPAQSLGNLRSAKLGAAPVALLPAWQLDRIARDVCAHRRNVVVHTELANLLDSSLFLSGRWRCNAGKRIGIGGGAARRAEHRLGLTPGMARTLGLPGSESWAASWRQRPKQVIAGAQTTPLVSGDRYPFRERTPTGSSLHRWRFATDADDTVLVSHLFYPYDGARTSAVRVDGRTVRPVLDTHATAAYRCIGCAGRVAWEVEAVTPHPERADIVVAE